MLKQPAYLTIKHAILANIHAGIWQTGAAIPTEIALSEQFGVSRMTVNRALKELEAERVLERRQGSGTFVAQQQFNHTFVEVRNIAEDIKASHRHYHASVHLLRTISPKQLPVAVYQRFLGAQKVPDTLFEIKIIHHANHIPLQYEERWVNANLVPDFIHQDFNQINTSDYLITHLPLETGDYTVSAINAPDEVAKALNIPSKDATLLLSRRTLSQGQVATVVHMWHAGSRYQFSGVL